MTGSTTIKRITAGAAVAVVAGVAAVPSALAAGEPKNEAPFTRAAVSRSLARQLAPSHVASSLVIRGEAKNQAPFTGLHVTVALSGNGEAKNESPFTRR